MAKLSFTYYLATSTVEWLVVFIMGCKHEQTRCLEYYLRNFHHRRLHPPATIINLNHSYPMNSPISLDEEVRLYTTNAEREKYNTLATLYGIIIALEYLERAYVRDSITSAECVSIKTLLSS